MWFHLSIEIYWIPRAPVPFASSLAAFCIVWNDRRVANSFKLVLAPNRTQNCSKKLSLADCNATDVTTEALAGRDESNVLQKNLLHAQLNLAV